MHDLGALMRLPPRKRLRQADQQQVHIRVGGEKLAARGKRDAGAVVAPHAIDCQCDHE
ncbi:hypothetical protein SDC9_194809 [bioreactor metagenome]|uniref:Uncharacterized protein n=1 Tax=bioreactor metagenome TaxID=1076179 RepID=A0A645I7H5_9ZZZZ